MLPEKLWFIKKIATYNKTFIQFIYVEKSGAATKSKLL